MVVIFSLLHRDCEDVVLGLNFHLILKQEKKTSLKICKSIMQEAHF